MARKKNSYDALRKQQLYDRYTHVDYHDPFKGEDVEASVEGLGGSTVN